MNPVLMLILFILVAFAAAFVGSQFAPGEWYEGLAKPSWNPPSWVFAPVWSVLYLLIGVSGWLVWREAGFRDATPAFVAFFVQLVLNAAWSWLFFGLHRPGLALVEILVLWAAILVTAILFGRVSPLAGWLLAPYLAWVGFAAILNWKLWQLNG